MHKLPGQEQPLAAKILYYPVSKCRELLEMLLEQYNLYMFNYDDEWTEVESNEYAQQAETAEVAFRRLFCDKQEFESPRALEDTLSRVYDEGDASDFIDKMTSWCEEHLRDHDKEDGASYTFCDGETVEDLNALLDPLIFSQHGLDVPSLSPLVEQVRIGVPASRVLCYVTLVDLPGNSIQWQLVCIFANNYYRCHRHE
jgi:hypothetical protein